MKANLWAGKLSSSLLPAVDMLTALAIVLAIFFGSSMVSGNELEIGVLIAFIMYIQRFFDPIRNLTMQYNAVAALNGVGRAHIRAAGCGAGPRG